MPDPPSVSIITQCNQREQHLCVPVRAPIKKQTEHSGVTRETLLEMRTELRDVKRGNILWDKNSREPSPPLYLSMHRSGGIPVTHKETGAQTNVPEKMQPTMDGLPRANFTFLPLSNPLIKFLSHLSKPARNQRSRPPRVLCWPLVPNAEKRRGTNTST